MNAAILLVLYCLFACINVSRLMNPFHPIHTLTNFLLLFFVVVFIINIKELKLQNDKLRMNLARCCAHHKIMCWQNIACKKNSQLAHSIS